MVQRGVPWLQKWSVFSEALDSCNGLTSEVWWGEKLSMTLVHYWQWFCSVKLGFTDVFSLCRDVWNGDRKGMSLVSRHMRGNSPVNGSFLWHFFVPPQWVHVQTIKEVFGSFPSEMYPTTPFVTKWCICLFPFVYFYLEGRPCQWSCSFLGKPTSCPWCAFCLAAFWDCM